MQCKEIVKILNDQTAIATDSKVCVCTVKMVFAFIIIVLFDNLQDPFLRVLSSYLDKFSEQQVSNDYKVSPIPFITKKYHQIADILTTMLQTSGIPIQGLLKYKNRYTH